MMQSGQHNTMARLILLCCLFNCVLSNPMLETALGTIHGRYYRIFDVEIESYLGIPYAKPPVELRRYTLPQPYGMFKDRKLNATKYPPSCPQTTLIKENMLGEGQSEDCLYLNVYRPRGTGRDDYKAVLVVIHSGGFVQGSSTDVHQLAEALVAVGDIILVSFNYRLGVLGFPNLKSYAPSNLGFWDQRTALRWVQDNIGDYGGDPNEVTLMGTSSGSMSIAAHIITQADGRNLFRSVIMDGGVLTSSALLEDITTSFRRINRIAKELGCPLDSEDMVECLQDSDLEDLMKASTKYLTDNGLSTFVPTADGFYVPWRTEEFVEQKQVLLRKVRMMIGYALDEGTMFADTKPFESDVTYVGMEREILELCRKTAIKFNYPLDFGEHETRYLVRSLYVEENPGSPFYAVAEFIGDGSFKCPINNFIRSYSRVNKDIYVYQFERRLNQTNFPFYNPELHGVFHSSPFLHFAGSFFIFEEKMDSYDEEFIRDIMKMITDFVNTRGAPSFRGMEWPRYPETGKVFILNDTARLRNGLPSDRKCRELFTTPYDADRIWVKPEL